MNWIELALRNCSDDADRTLGCIITGNLSSLNKYFCAERLVTTK
jgi:hypothetical protein